MSKDDPLLELFDTLIEDELENKIMRFIIQGKSEDEILKQLLEISGDTDD